MAVSVKAILGFDGRAFEAGIKRARTSLNSLAKGAMKSAVAQNLSVGYISSQMRQVGDFAKQVKNLAPALGMTTDELQQWEYVFARTGLSLDDVADAFATLADRTEDALVGTESMIEDFRLIGITVDQLKGKNPAQLFELFADGVERTTDRNRALTAIVRNLGDDLGRKLAPMLMKGSEGLKEMRKEAENLGIIMEGETIQKVAERMAELQITSMRLRSVWGDIASVFSKLLTSLSDGVRFFNIFNNVFAGAGAMYGTFESTYKKDGLFGALKNSAGAGFEGFQKPTWDLLDEIAKREAAFEKRRKEAAKGEEPPTRKGEGINDLIDLKNARDAYNKKVDDHNFKQMGHEEKVTTLLKQREEIQKRMRAVSGKEYFNLAGQSLDLLLQAQALTASRVASGTRSQGLTASQSVGAFVARSNPLIGIARKQLRTQEQIRDTLQNPKNNSTVNDPHGTGVMPA